MPDFAPRTPVLYRSPGQRTISLGAIRSQTRLPIEPPLTYSLRNGDNLQMGWGRRAEAADLESAKIGRVCAPAGRGGSYAWAQALPPPRTPRTPRSPRTATPATASARPAHGLAEPVGPRYSTIAGLKIGPTLAGFEDYAGRRIPRTLAGRRLVQAELPVLRSTLRG
eukprot:SAG22_NODE_147_length_17533_cov_46.384536_5_plen_167_part_00